MEPHRFSRRAFLKSTATLAAANAIGLPELSWREAWAANATGGTTLTKTIRGTGGKYQKLAYGPGEPYLLREELGVTAQAGRQQRRTTLLYFAQLSDTHVLDAKSPGRVEYVDTIPGGLSAFRPHEVTTPFVLDAMVRQLNTLRSSEISGAALAFAINTGDTTDNQQFNELRRVIDILDGGPITLRSGGVGYEGVQKGNTLAAYYHPDQPLVDSYGQTHEFPAYPGMLDNAELPFTAAGVGVPWYTLFGNHDGLVQGNLPASPAFDRIATGRVKIIGFPFGPAQRDQIARDMLRGDITSWLRLQEWAAAHRESQFVMLVTPDERRRFVPHREWINEHFTTTGLPVGHGFTQQNVENDIGYYTFDPAPGIHCVVLDTCNTAGGASGNVDDVQFKWLAADLAAHPNAITLVFGHHTISSLNNPKPRPSDPHPHLGPELEQLFWGHPGVVAFINGHLHQNLVIAHANPATPGSGFWEINTAAHIDWPEQARLIELFDNGDGTLSIFATIFDHMAAPDATSLSPMGLAAISRELAFNDPQFPRSLGSGTPADRNVELLVRRRPL